MKDVLIAWMVLTYNITLIVGTAYLVQVYDWSMWTFLLTTIFFVTKTKD